MAERAVRRISYLAGYAVDVFIASMSIDGKVVAIAGASSGIGRAAAMLLAERGALVCDRGSSTGSRSEPAVTEISPGMIATNFGDTITDLPTKKMIEERLGPIAISPESIARGIAFVIEQPPEVDVGSIVICPKAQE
jgi:NADP-dependent 3-hydroxy acid dehydrogenase YdfG